MRKVLLSPHNDDAVLFATFTLLKHKPTVVTVFDSYVQVTRLRRAGRYSDAIACDSVARRREDKDAFRVLDVDYGYVGLRDDRDDVAADFLADKIAFTAELSGGPAEVWAPMFEDGGHAQHNAVARAADRLADQGAAVHRYTTYTRSGGRTRGVEVIPEPAWVLQKLHAMACYSSQITIGELGCWPWFMSLAEYTDK